MIGPGLRRALHEALDHVVDALNEDERQAPVKARRYRAPYVPTPEELARVSPEAARKADEALARAAARGGRRR